MGQEKRIIIIIAEAEWSSGGSLHYVVSIGLFAVYSILYTRCRDIEREYKTLPQFTRMPGISLRTLYAHGCDVYKCDITQTHEHNVQTTDHFSGRTLERRETRMGESEIEGEKSSDGFSSTYNYGIQNRCDSCCHCFDAANAIDANTKSIIIKQQSRRSTRFVRMESWQFRRNSTRKVAKKWCWRVPREELDKKTAKMLKQSNININNSIDTAHWNCIFTVLYPLSSVAK